MHHATARSIAEEHIFKDSGDYVTGIRLLAELVDAGFLACHAFCFMPTHYHLYATFEDVEKAMHKLNRRYAVAYNRRYRRRGHVFDSPYKAIELTSERHFVALPRYIALNPPNYESWPYSSYPGLIGRREAFSFVDPTPILDAFGTVEAFREFVDAGRDV
jgi:putative transposase